MLVATKRFAVDQLIGICLSEGDPGGIYFFRSCGVQQ